MDNPLQKYYRQPKVYLSLPSQGQYYPEGTLEGDPTNLPVFGMTAMDEIIFKTPDALFSGESTVSCIRSCIPGIKDPWSIPQIDIDSILIAIRIATYGQYMDSNYKCSKCEEENTVSIDLSKTLDYFAQTKFSSKVDVFPIQVYLRPFSYKEQTDMAMKQYELQRMLLQTTGESIEEPERNKRLDEFYTTLARYQVESYKQQIDYVEADDFRVNSKEEIIDFINNSDRAFFDAIRKHLEAQQEVWKIPLQPSACGNCSHENTVSFSLDQSNFFVKR